MTFTAADVVDSHGRDDPGRFIAAADEFLERDDLPLAAAALDRAYGLAPHDADLARHRAALLDQLAVAAHGVAFRYVPAGTFVMGSPHGDPDERPVRPVRVPGFWITEAPITWTRACAWLGWEPPPHGLPRDGSDTHLLSERNKLRYQYCSTSPPEERWSPDEATPERCDVLPMVAVGYLDAEAIARAIGCALPTEAQWEKAARGGLVGCTYSWGDEPPTRARCDFDRMGEFRLADPRALPPNGYGLYGMCGGVWEWTADRYDALAYTGARADDGERAIRGGSWTDCAAAVTVSFRSSSADAGAGLSIRGAANVGFRVVSEHDPRSRPSQV